MQLLPWQVLPLQLLPWQVDPALALLPLQLLWQLPPPKLKNEMIRPWNTPPEQPVQLPPWHLAPSDCELLSEWQPLPPARSRKNPLACVVSGAVVSAAIITRVYIGVILSRRRRSSSVFDTLGNLVRHCQKISHMESAGQNDLK